MRLADLPVYSSNVIDNAASCLQNAPGKHEHDTSLNAQQSLSTVNRHYTYSDCSQKCYENHYSATMLGIRIELRKQTMLAIGNGITIKYLKCRADLNFSPILNS